MKRLTGLAIALAASVYAAPATAGSYSYSKTLQNLRDITNTLTRYCGTHADRLPLSNTRDFSQACGQAFHGTAFYGHPFAYARTVDMEQLLTTERWVFFFDYESHAYAAAFVRQTVHQSADRDRTQDTTGERLEVHRLDKSPGVPGGGQVYRITNGDAWRGRMAGQDRKDATDGPSGQDYAAGITTFLSDLRELRFRIREGYGIE